MVIDPYLKNRAQKRTQKKFTAANKAKRTNKAFLRKTQFQIYKQQGLSDDEAARRVGVNIPFGRPWNIIDIMKKIEEGE